MASKLDLALVVRTIDQATRPLRNIQRAVRQVGRQTGLDRVARNAGTVGRRLKTVGVETLALARRVGTIMATIGVATGGFAISASAQMETLRTSFVSMLGSEEAAADMVERLQEFAATTPFQLLGIGRATKSLLAFGVEGDNMIDTLTFLGDIAAGTGVPLNDLAQIYGKAMSKGKVQTEELNQLAERGVPILDLLVQLAGKYGNEISKADVYKAAERGTISFEALDEALRMSTADGGLFADQMIRQSETLAGKFSTLKDNIFNNAAAIGDELVKAFGVKEGMTALTEWLGTLQERTNNFEFIGQTVRELGETFRRLGETAQRAVDWLRETFPWLGELMDQAKATAGEVSPLTWAVGGLGLVLGTKLIKAIAGTFWPLIQFGASMVRAAFKTLLLVVSAGLALPGALKKLATATIPNAIGAVGRLGKAMVLGAWRTGLLVVMSGVALVNALRKVVTASIPAAIGALGRLGKAMALGAFRTGLLAVMSGIALVNAFGRVTKTAIPAVIGALKLMGTVMLANPIFAVLAAIALAAGLIYHFWDDIAPFFKRIWGKIVEYFDVSAWVDTLAGWGDDVWKAMLGWFHGIGPWFEGIWEKITGVFDVGAWAESLAAGFMGIVNWLKDKWLVALTSLNPFGAIWNWVLPNEWKDSVRAWFSDLNLFEIGERWVQGLWDGIQNVWSRLMAWLDEALSGLTDTIGAVADAFGWVGRQLGFGDDEGETEATGGVVPKAFRFGARREAANDDEAAARPRGGRFAVGRAAAAAAAIAAPIVAAAEPVAAAAGPVVEAIAPIAEAVAPDVAQLPSAAAPSLIFPPEPEAAPAATDTRPRGGRFAAQDRAAAKAAVTVDVKVSDDRPPRARVRRMSADDDVDLEVNAGQALQSAY